jgi:hypothetical protein
MRLCLRLLQLDGVWGGTGAQGGGGEGEGIKNEGCHGVKACRFALRRLQPWPIRSFSALLFVLTFW